MPREATALERALAKLRASTELALGYPDATITPAEARAVLELVERLDSIRALPSASDLLTNPVAHAMHELARYG